jgi:hypothetical protein
MLVSEIKVYARQKVHGMGESFRSYAYDVAHMYLSEFSLTDS